MQSSMLSSVVLPLALFIIMLGLGLGLTKNDFKIVFARPKAVLVGVLGQMLLLPLVAFMLVSMFTISAELAMGIMILSLCPGGTTSNLFTYIAKGDVALSVSLTAIVSLIAPFTIPIVFNISSHFLIGHGQAITLPVLQTIIQLCAITILPISVGMLVRGYKASLAIKAEKPLRVFSVVFLMLIVVSLIIKSWHQLPSFIASVGSITLLLNIVCMVLGFVMAKAFMLQQKQAVSICLEIGLQNGTTALMITLSLLENATMAIGPTIYSLIMFISGAGFAWWASNKAKR